MRQHKFTRTILVLVLLLPFSLMANSLVGNEGGNATDDYLDRGFGDLQETIKEACDSVSESKRDECIRRITSELLEYLSRNAGQGAEESSED